MIDNLKLSVFIAIVAWLQCHESFQNFFPSNKCPILSFLLSHQIITFLIGRIGFDIKRIGAKIGFFEERTDLAASKQFPCKLILNF